MADRCSGEATHSLAGWMTADIDVVFLSPAAAAAPPHYFTLAPPHAAKPRPVFMRDPHLPALPPTLRCTWLAHARGEPAEPRVRAWAAAELGCPPGALRLTRDAHGRPQLDAPADFDLSWSHSGDGLLVALGEGVEVGIDLERARPRPRALELARRFFHPAEAAWLATLPAIAREPAFLRLWCAKEAVLKAHGRGIAFGLHRFELREESLPLEGVQLAIVAGDAELRGPWSLREWVPCEGYFAALAWRAR